MIVKLGEVASEKREIWRGSKNGIPVVGLEHIIPNEVKLSSWDTDSENTFSKAFRKGQVLFGRRRAYLKKAALAPIDGICSGDITVIEANAKTFLPDLLPFVIQNDTFFDYAVGKSAGSLSPRVKWEHLKNYEFNLPPLSEQRKLADLLWAANAAKEAYKELLAATDELVKSQFVEMFGDNDWNVCRLEEICDEIIAGGDVPKASFSKVYSDDYNVPIFSNGEKNNGFYGYTDTARVFKPSVTISARGTIGFTAIRETPFLPIVRLVSVTPSEKLNVYYLNEALKDKDGLNSGSSIQQLTVPTVKKLTLPIPPITLQNRFADFVRQADKSIFVLQQMIDIISAKPYTLN